MISTVYARKESEFIAIYFGRECEYRIARRAFGTIDRRTKKINLWGHWFKLVWIN